LVDGYPRIEQDRNDAGPYCSPEQGRKFNRVEQHDRDPIFLFDAETRCFLLGEFVDDDQLSTALARSARATVCFATDRKRRLTSQQAVCQPPRQPRKRPAANSSQPANVRLSARTRSNSRVVIETTLPLIF